METGEIVHAVLIDGVAYRRLPDGGLELLVGESDWARVDAMTDEELTANAESDPDARPMTDEEWAAGELVIPPKVPVGIRLDADIIDWFKAKGPGYQTRINGVLRRYMEAQRKAG
jgi:uncharacterized protein (DUF4415 family)